MKKTLFTLCLVCLIQMSFGQPGTVKSVVNFLELNKSITDENPNDILFGHGVSYIGDVDDDGNRELVLRAHNYSTSEFVVYICFLDNSKKVKRYQRIGRNLGGLVDDLPQDMDNFGAYVVGLEDLNNDGVEDIAISNSSYDFISRGEFIIAFLNSDGTVKESKTIKPNAHGFNRGLNPNDAFGCSLANIGDLNGDGNPELLVGARGNDFDYNNGGIAFVLFLNTDGTILKYKMLSELAPNFPKVLGVGSSFGGSVAHVQTIGIETIVAVGAAVDTVNGERTGSVLLMRLDSGANILSTKIIAYKLNGFNDSLHYQSGFGNALAGMRDIDGDGIFDLAIAGARQKDGGLSRGAVWIVFLNSDMTVKSHQRISETQGNVGLTFENHDEFGTGLSFVEDWNGDGRYDLAVTMSRISPQIGLVAILELNGVDHTGIIKNSNADLIKIFPNPSGQRLIAETGSDEQQTVQIFNVEGRMVYHQTIEAGTTRFELDVSGFENGIYLMSVHTGNAVSRSKFIVQH